MILVLVCVISFKPSPVVMPEKAAKADSLVHHVGQDITARCAANGVFFLNCCRAIFGKFEACNMCKISAPSGETAISNYVITSSI